MSRVTDTYPFTVVNASSDQLPTQGEVSWRSPSNIALVKYWGKKPIQIPANASISFTLSDAHTNTTTAYQLRKSQAPFLKFYFEGRDNPAFAVRIEKFLKSLFPIMPWIEHYSWTIKSENSFPHSSGIASSASSMSALALCLCDIENEILRQDTATFYKKASYIARLGSGSAARSVFPTLCSWGEHESIVSSSDLYGTLYEGHHPIFSSFHDDIAIVSKEEKSVSSSAGHSLMDNNIFASSRYKQASQHLRDLLSSLESGNLSSFGKIVEDEALTLHALMMCSDPSYVLMEPNTLDIIKRIRTFRKDTGRHIYFTLDAGPNVHILYPDQEKEPINDFIKSEIQPLCEDGRIINDHVGPGPIKL